METDPATVVFAFSSQPFGLRPDQFLARECWLEKSWTGIRRDIQRYVRGLQSSIFASD